MREHKIHPEGIEVALEIINGVPELLLERFINKVNNDPKEDILTLWKQTVDSWFERYTFKTGDTVKAFNSNEWLKTGDIGNNSQFWQKATVLKTRRDKYGSPLADLKFENGMVSHGHFQHTLEKL